MFDVSNSNDTRHFHPEAVTRNVSRAATTNPSVSGRGTNTPGSTRSERSMNCCSPVTCCSGVPEHRAHSDRPKALAA